MTRHNAEERPSVIQSFFLSHGAFHSQGTARKEAYGEVCRLGRGGHVDLPKHSAGHKITHRKFSGFFTSCFQKGHFEGQYRAVE